MKPFTFLLLTGSLVMVLSGCKQKTDATALPPEVEVVEVMVQDFPLIRTFVGQTYGVADIAIRARVEGFLESIHFEEGFPVEKGQLLYTIDPQPFLAREAEALSKVAEAKTMLVKAKSDLDRYKPLAEINAVSQSDLDFAVAQYGAAEASLEAAEAALRAARIELGYTKMYAPIDGIIGRTQAKVGDFVGREPNPVVLNTVSNIETIQVRFFLTENEYLYLTRYYPTDQTRETDSRKRGNLTLELADGSLHEHKGSVDFIDRSLDPATGSILLQASFPNPGRTLRPGQFAKVILEFEMIENAVLVPQRCITDLQGQQSVYVVKEDQTVEYREVEATVTRDGLWLVQDGLNPGEKVVFEGLQKVRSGMAITPDLVTFSIESPENEGPSNTP
jgi:membrane fusion protein (multidrug efflux system)